MTPVTKKDLEYLVDRINRDANTPIQPYIDGIVQPGNYHLSWAYGGVKLVQICNEGGGERDITSGYGTKRELYYQMQAFLRGLEASAA